MDIWEEKRNLLQEVREHPEKFEVYAIRPGVYEVYERRGNHLGYIFGRI